MPLMTIDIGAHPPAGKETSRLPPTPGAGSGAQAGDPGTAQGASPKAFGQLMADAFRQNHPHGHGHAQTEEAAGAGDPTQTGESMAPIPGLEAEGQNLASTGTAKTDTTVSLPPDTALLPDWLQAMTQPLAVQPMTPGSSLQVITPSTPAPDDASLIAFAQTQGLDAKAIAQLLQKPPTQGSQGWMQASGLNGQTGTAGLTGGTPGAMSGPAAAPPSTPSSGLQPVFLAGAPGAGMTEVAAQASAQNAVTAAAPLPASLASTAAWISATPGADKTATLSPDDHSLESATGLEQNPLLAGLRRALAGSPTSGTVARAPGNWTFTPPQTTRWSESELDLGASLATDDGASTSDMPLTSSALLSGDNQQPPREVTSQPATLGSSASAAAKTENGNPTLGAGRSASDQMQQLGEQMADAVGERMMREIERGHWNLRLMLKPAHLGHIEVEMRLHAGGLDASFTTSQAGTRELLQDGLDKLKDTLSQMGMDIANLDVKTGQNRQNGEDPTPGQAASVGTPSSRDNPDQPAQTTGWTPRPRRPDGWDVMV